MLPTVIEQHAGDSSEKGFSEESAPGLSYGSEKMADQSR